MIIRTTKYEEIERRGRWLGKKYWNAEKQKMAHEFRCPICGKWVRYNDEEIQRFIAEGRWDFRKNRLAHCGNSTCWDYYIEVQKDLARKIKMNSFELYKELKRRALVQ